MFGTGIDFSDQRLCVILLESVTTDIGTGD